MTVTYSEWVDDWKNSQLPEETKPYPSHIILPSAHPLTQLIIKDKHERSFHAGTQATGFREGGILAYSSKE